MTDEELAELWRTCAKECDGGDGLALFINRTIELTDGSGRGMYADDFRDRVLALTGEVRRLRAGVAELAETMRYPECGELSRHETYASLRRLLGDDC
jgi:hypothetical protein